PATRRSSGAPARRRGIAIAYGRVLAGRLRLPPDLRGDGRTLRAADPQRLAARAGAEDRHGRAGGVAPLLFEPEAQAKLAAGIPRLRFGLKVSANVAPDADDRLTDRPAE